MPILAQINRSHLFYHHSIDEKPDSGTRHCHALYEIYYFISGSGEYYVEGSRVHLRPYTLILMKPAAYHYFHVTGDSPYERCALHFHPDVLPVSDRDLLLAAFKKNNGDQNGPSVLAVAKQSELLSAFKRIDRACLLPEDERRLMSQAILAEMLTLIVGCRRRPCQSEEPVHMITRTLVSDIIEYLNAHLAERLTLDSLAASFFVSKYHLCRTFKRATGATVLEYLTQKRILQARELLEQGLSPSLVAGQCGFSDYSTFYRAYRQLSGCAPSQTLVRQTAP
ncbi:MAG: AraC family transcriptional regulator [Ruminococcaceae bacterium]|nr:AraC family transcriptional regulator [Oscillospiraceae bacterium]